jgi:hypothetical protein
MTILLLAGLVYAQSTCGPNPVPMMQGTQQVYSQTQQQLKQRQMLEAQFNFQQSMAKLQHNFRLQQMDSQNNPQAMQQAAQSFQQQQQQLQQQFQQQMQNIQRMP